jgi:hypothetical protein
MRRSILWLIVSGIAFCCAANMANVFADLKHASRSSYGYSPDDPVRIGYSGDMQKNIGFCYYYIAGLRTANNKELRITGRGSLPDPNNKPGIFESNRRWGGTESCCMLDKYYMVAENSTDTLSLYFDIYHKEPLLIPKGLSFTPPTQ